MGARRVVITAELEYGTIIVPGPLIEPSSTLRRNSTPTDPLAMQTPRSTRSSVLGKRSHQSDTPQCDRVAVAHNPPTPEPTPNPKRVRISTTSLDGDANKENVAPFHGEVLDDSPTSARASRALRRTSTGTPSPSRQRPSKR